MVFPLRYHGDQYYNEAVCINTKQLPVNFELDEVQS